MTIYITLDNISADTYNRGEQEDRVWNTLRKHFTPEELQNCEIEDWDDKGNWVVNDGKDGEIMIDEVNEYDKIYSYFGISGYSKIGNKIYIYVDDHIGGTYEMEGELYDRNWDGKKIKVMQRTGEWEYIKGPYEPHHDSYRLKKSLELVEQKISKLVTSDWEQMTVNGFHEGNLEIKIFLYELINL